MSLPAGGIVTLTPETGYGCDIRVTAVGKRWGRYPAFTFGTDDPARAARGPLEAAKEEFEECSRKWKAWAKLEELP